MFKFVRGLVYHCHDLVINMITHNVDVMVLLWWSLYLTLYVSDLT